MNARFKEIIVLLIKQLENHPKCVTAGSDERDIVHNCRFCCIGVSVKRVKNTNP
jgi:hypothetical protein